MPSFDPDRVSIPVGHYISGAVIEESDRRVSVIRPSDGKFYADLPIADAQMVDRAVTSAREAHQNSAWASQAPRLRAEIMRRWARLIEDNAEELSRIESLGSTRPIAQVLADDVPHLIETIHFFAELADKRGGSVASTGDDSFGFTVREPHGVIAAILPWNYPLGVAGWKIAPALSAGNAVVVKPSEMTPFSVVRLAQLATEAGVPNGILNVVQGPGNSSGALLVKHAGIDKITFTGSTRAGAIIAADVARHGIKPLTLELGGKSPQLVFRDADIPLAGKAIAKSILNNAGQECVAGSRLLVHRDRKEELLEQVRSHMRAIKPGATWLAETQYSPIISARQMADIEAIIAEAIDQGASVIAGGRRLSGGLRNFLEPTILDHVSQSNPAIAKEIFASVLTVQTFDDESEAIALANNSQYGLAAGVFTHDLSRALRVMKRLAAGTVWINRYGRTNDFIIPTGGYKQSGVGKDLGIEAFDGSLKVKSVLIGVDI